MKDIKMHILLSIILVLYCACEASSVKDSTEVFESSFFAKTPFISSEELSEEEANQVHSIESQSSSTEQRTNIQHYVVWDDYECEFYGFDIFFFVDCYMRYFGFQHHGRFVRGHKGLYSKSGRVIKMGAINAIIKYFTGCDMLLTNEDDPFEWNRETKAREMKAEDPSPRCQHVHRRRQAELIVKNDNSSNGAVDIYYEDKGGNIISISSEGIDSYHITITALHKGVMKLSRTGTHKFHFGLQCLLCGDNIEVYEDCEWRKVRYSNYKDFDLRFSNACQQQSTEESSESESSETSEAVDEKLEEDKTMTDKVVPAEQQEETEKSTPEPTTVVTPTSVPTTSIPTTTPKPVNKGRVIDFGEKLIRGGQGGIQ